jgi:alpha-D-ribose 1-methylphosphonate 5-triphosphate synthase subunit PhnG
MPAGQDHIFEKTDIELRRAAMAVLARATSGEIESQITSHFPNIDGTDLRPPEIGLVMLRGRIGGGGSPFNVGEATVTRAAVKLPSGEVGFAYVLGRDEKKARLAALCDALWQKRSRDVERHILAPLRNAQQKRRDLERAQTAATRVDFFTLVRGEDEA